MLVIRKKALTRYLCCKGEQPVLRGVLAVLKNVCGRCSRLLVVSTAHVPGQVESTLSAASTGGAIAEMFAGALLTAQLEYLKCTMTMCYLSLPLNAMSCGDGGDVVGGSDGVARVLGEVVLTELGLQCLPGLSADNMGQEIEVFYQLHPSGDDTSATTQLVRKVRRYHQDESLTMPAQPTHAGVAIHPPLLQAAGVYVITGGLGGLGLLTAQCLVCAGARKIVLLSRSGTVAYQGQGLEEMLQALRDAPNVEVTVLKCDVSVEVQVVHMLAQARMLGPIAGIIHAAGVLSDGLIVTGKAEDGALAVWNAKAKSAHLLHNNTQLDQHLHMFVVFSSVTAAIGTAGQAAYAAANRYLESLMNDRRRTGQCGLCVRWPEVSGVGMAAALHGAGGSDNASDRTCAVTAAQVEAFLLDLFAGPSMAQALAQDRQEAVITLMPPVLVELYRGSRMGSQLQTLPSIERAPTSAGSNAPTAHNVSSGAELFNPTPVPSVLVPTFTAA